MMLSEGAGPDGVVARSRAGCSAASTTSRAEGRHRRRPPREFRFPARSTSNALALDWSRRCAPWPSTRGVSVARRSRSPGCCYQPVVSTVIVGAKRADQLADNLAASEVELTADDMAELDEARRPAAGIPGLDVRDAGCQPRRVSRAVARSDRSTPKPADDLTGCSAAASILRIRRTGGSRCSRCWRWALDEAWWLVSPAIRSSRARAWRRSPRACRSAQAMARRAAGPRHRDRARAGHVATPPTRCVRSKRLVSAAPVRVADGCGQSRAVSSVEELAARSHARCRLR